MRAVPSEMNVSDFAMLLSMVSGYGNKSIDNKIPSGGLDYKNLRVQKQADEVMKYLNNVSPDAVKQIEKFKQG